jgi:hypothetical protein
MASTDVELAILALDMLQGLIAISSPVTGETVDIPVAEQDILI